MYRHYQALAFPIVVETPSLPVTIDQWLPVSNWVRIDAPWRKHPPAEFPLGALYNPDATLTIDQWLPVVYRVPRAASPRAWQGIVPWQFDPSVIVPPSTPVLVRTLLDASYREVLDMQGKYETVISLHAKYVTTLYLAANVGTEQNIAMIRGEDWILEFRMAPPVDITGWAITWQLKDSIGGTSRITKTVGSGITITNGPKSIFRVSLAAANTSALSAAGYKWDARRTDSGSNKTLAWGNLNLLQGVTE